MMDCGWGVQGLHRCLLSLGIIECRWRRAFRRWFVVFLMLIGLVNTKTRDSGCWFVVFSFFLFTICFVESNENEKQIHIHTTLIITK